jgi:ABC transporter family protein
VVRDDVVQLTSDPDPLRGRRLLGLALERQVVLGQGRGLPPASDEHPGQPERGDHAGQEPGRAERLPAEQRADVHRSGHLRVACDDVDCQAEAGKTTLLNLAVGMLAPTSGTIEVLGGRPASGPAQLAKVGFVAQDDPVYARFSILDHLRFGAHLNPDWDAALARDRIDRLGLDPRQRAGRLSGGQRAQLALTLALPKRPELLILDEPIASLDQGEPVLPRRDDVRRVGQSGS